MIVFVVISLGLTMLFRSLTPETETTKSGFSSIKPGQTIKDPKLTDLGEPISSYTTDYQERVYLYPSEVPVHPREIYLNTNNKVVLMKDFYAYDELKNLSNYIERYGEPDLVLQDTNSPDSLKANVFLKQGIVVVAHVDGGNIEQRWDFEPMDEESFLKGPGRTLSVYGHGPEKTLDGFDGDL